MALLFLVLAGCAVVGGADGMVAVRVTVAAHVTEPGHLLHRAMSAIVVGVFGLVILFVGCELGDGGGELADLLGHQREFGILAFASFTHVGNGVVVCDGHACKLGNVVLDLVADVGHAVGGFVVVAPGCSAAAVLDVGAVGFDAHLEPDLDEFVVGFCDVQLLLPLQICYSRTSAPDRTGVCPCPIW